MRTSIKLVGKRFKEIKEKSGLSTERFVRELSFKSRKLSMSRQTWENYEDEKSEPKPSTLRLIAKVLGVDMEYFFRN